jgi:outer membrane protein OmpA-like peptidoglycan-associated protein
MKNLLRSFIISLFIFSGSEIKAQDFLTFIHDNYAGATGMHYNPASIVDSRYKFDMEFIGFSNRIENNWVNIDNSLIFNWFKWNEANFKNNYLSMSPNGQTKDVYLGLEARAFSFMFNLNKKNAIGFSFRTRAIANFDNIPESAALLVFNGNDVDSLLKHHVFEDLSQTVTTWAEYGISWGRVIIDNQQHFLKAGATAKLLQGIGSIYLYEKYLEYDLENPDTATDVTADIKFGLTGNLDDMAQFKFGAKPSIGLDLGFVYEWRPKYKDHLYNMDGERDIWQKDENKYKARIAFSILDIGSMKFQKQYNSGNFLIDTNIVTLAMLHADNLVDLADSINKYYGTENTNSYFSMRLPTTFNLSIDYNIYKKLYINLSGRLALNNGTNHIEKIHYISNLSLAPRFEAKWWGINIPMNYNQYQHFTVGTGVRLGPIWFGSSDILALAGLRSTITGSDLHVAIKIPILYKAPKDKDGDMVSNKMDECPDSKGEWALKGCPDSDKDGIINSKDDCPYTAGLAEFNGCPDTDKDGVQDKYDQCPDAYGEKQFGGCPDSDGDGIIDLKDSCKKIAGLPEFNGCPDNDGDKIPDFEDECPEEAGLAAFNGCPDTDNDGIRDADDHCPTLAGLDSLQGCPYIDTDNDGIQDKNDNCPKLAGTIENKGCPETDTDKDGVIDKDDFCPMTPGPVDNNGCPVIAKEEQEILDTAFANLEFETGKSIILSTSFNSLNKIVELMNKKTDFKLLIEGHTDDVGQEESNLILSQNRAIAVQNYLIGRGINYNRITSRWYGETKPIADNSTEEGRQKNRRVELMIIFD